MAQMTRFWENMIEMLDIPFMLMLQKDVTYIFLDSSHYFLELRYLMKQAAMLKRSMWQGNQGYTGPPAGKQSLVQQPARDWILPTTTWVSWEVDPSLVEPSDETVATANTLPSVSWEKPWEDSYKPFPYPWPQKLWDNKCVLLHSDR